MQFRDFNYLSLLKTHVLHIGLLFVSEFLKWLHTSVNYCLSMDGNQNKLGKPFLREFYKSSNI